MAHSPAFPLSLPPGVWQGRAWAAAQQRVQPTGHAALDAELPGGGWPCGALSELLLPPHAACEWTLLLPALACLLRQDGTGRAVLVAPPQEPFGAALHDAGVAVQRLCCIQPPACDPGDGAAAWACEQALRCRDVCAVLAWLPQARAATLRRLQLAAEESATPLVLLRPDSLVRQPSPAVLRLALAALPGGVDVRILKRRGPPLAASISIDLPGLMLAARADAWRQARPQPVPVALFPPPGPRSGRSPVNALVRPLSSRSGPAGIHPGAQ